MLGKKYNKVEDFQARQQHQSHVGKNSSLWLVKPQEWVFYCLTNWIHLVSRIHLVNTAVIFSIREPQLHCCICNQCSSAPAANFDRLPVTVTARTAINAPWGTRRWWELSTSFALFSRHFTVIPCILRRIAETLGGVFLATHLQSQLSP